VASTTEVCQAIYAVHGTIYECGDVLDSEYSGFALDWYYGNATIKYSYLVELRDQGEYGFLLPEDQIIPSGEETYAGMKAAIKFVQDNDMA
uniref:Carboxypeptidase B-like n=1 Tax=Saccoglossus kowalevskii TaxID=10224 RepID=A0ABM0GNQ2_SACKO